MNKILGSGKNTGKVGKFCQSDVGAMVIFTVLKFSFVLLLYFHSSRGFNLIA